MEYSIDTIISIITLLLGGGGGAFFTWRYARRKARAEAVQAETTAAKESQDMYQQLIADLKTDREYQRDQMEEVRRSYDQMKQERDELRKQFDRYDEDIRNLKNDVARNGRIVQLMRPFMCGRQQCPDRVSVTISDRGEVSRQRNQKTPKPENPEPKESSIEPVEPEAL